jgi:membrane-associated phospholipid phosphatase
VQARAALAAFLVLFATELANGGAARADEGRQLRYDWGIDGAITLGGGALWVGSELLKKNLAPATCRWCAEPGIDASVRDALRSGDTTGADTASSILGFAVVPLFTLGADVASAAREGRAKEAPGDALVILEAAMIAADLNQATKFVVGRERPFVHALPPDQKGSTSQPADNNLSFYSGHTTLAFTLATASGTVASMRGYRDAPAIWVVGMTLATLTGYMRIAADKHYFTDVVTGALIGGGVGFAVPYLFHRPKTEMSVAPMSGASGLSVSGAF